VGLTAGSRMDVPGSSFISSRVIRVYLDLRVIGEWPRGNVPRMNILKKFCAMTPGAWRLPSRGRVFQCVTNDSSNGKAPDEVIIGGAFNTLPRHGFTAICGSGNRAL
jgi:hypothetical protein